MSSNWPTRHPLAPTLPLVYSGTLTSEFRATPGLALYFTSIRFPCMIVVRISCHQYLLCRQEKIGFDPMRGFLVIDNAGAPEVCSSLALDMAWPCSMMIILLLFSSSVVEQYGFHFLLFVCYAIHDTMRDRQHTPYPIFCSRLSGANQRPGTQDQY